MHISISIVQILKKEKIIHRIVTLLERRKTKLTTEIQFDNNTSFDDHDGLEFVVRVFFALVYSVIMIFFSFSLFCVSFFFIRINIQFLIVVLCSCLLNQSSNLSEHSYNSVFFFSFFIIIIIKIQLNTTSMNMDMQHAIERNTQKLFVISFVLIVYRSSFSFFFPILMTNLDDEQND